MESLGLRASASILSIPETDREFKVFQDEEDRAFHEVVGKRLREVDLDSMATGPLTWGKAFMVWDGEWKLSPVEEYYRQHSMMDFFNSRWWAYQSLVGATVIFMLVNIA